MASTRPAAPNGPSGRAVAQIDLNAIERNCALLKKAVGRKTELCAVVKADGYGHGAVHAAKAAQAGGAAWLAVAAAAEAEELRHHHLAGRLLVMGALNRADLDTALRSDADIAVWSREFLEVVDRRAGELGIVAGVHVKLDTGMGRLGTAGEDQAFELVELAGPAGLANVELAGLMTHFATADERGDDYFPKQLERFASAAQRVKEIDAGCLVHAANSAATLRDPEAHFDMVRCGIAIYGMDPFHENPAEHGLEPALALSSYVAAVKRFEPGQTAGYGRRWRAEQPTDVAFLPIGYGDGVRRGLTNVGEALIGGRRCPFAGTVSMDNTAVDVGPGGDVQCGAPAVLIGTQGGESILAEHVACELGTINYEITCGLSQRVERHYRRT